MGSKDGKFLFKTGLGVPALGSVSSWVHDLLEEAFSAQSHHAGGSGGWRLGTIAT